MYAIVDIETTGGHAMQNRITEISIFVHDGQKIIDHFESLVHPEMTIPPYIQAFTGISNEMVANAPHFSGIAEKVFKLLDGNIFIAHNVNFDHSFIKHQLQESGYDLQVKKLCTVRLSRKIVPGHRSYSLGNICAALHIQLENRHRAGGDALATVKLFEYLIAHDTENHIDDSLKRGSKEQVLPPNVSKSDFEKLPKSPGVYYFVNDKGLAVYVGKAKNIRTRVGTHFSGDLKGKQKQNFMRDVHGFSHTQTGNELLAILLESHEIRRLWPDENRAQKKVQQVYGLFDYLDQNNKIRFGIEKVRKDQKPLVAFSTHAAALQYLNELINEYGLCPKLCNSQTNKADCIQVQHNICDGYCLVAENVAAYNAKAQSFFDFLTSERKAYFIVGKGRNYKEQAVIIYEPGNYIGYIFVSLKEQIDFDHVKENATPLKLNSLMETVLAQIVNGEKSKGYKVYTQMKMAVEI
ncbi:MAG: GIY-YIG nuclease family protein [Bacteroidia bacterium]|nr:GIY-YIG nuclease family protein [Bacteroidia bacterium]MCF8425266.1 GIY-YIG nuclease family protein [Bacteroidia bacterium]MCF8446512.1 GIY-YIG nuclease family protein [Bacteroidia bacterium]